MARFQVQRRSAWLTLAPVVAVVVKFAAVALSTLFTLMCVLGSLNAVEMTGSIGAGSVLSPYGSAFLALLPQPGFRFGGGLRGSLLHCRIFLSRWRCGYRCT